MAKKEFKQTLNKEDLMYLGGFMTAYNAGQLKIPAKTKSIAHCAKMRLYRAAKKLMENDDLITEYPDLFEARRETSVAVKEIHGEWFVVISRVDATEFNNDFRMAMRQATTEAAPYMDEPQELPVAVNTISPAAVSPALTSAKAQESEKRFAEMLEAKKELELAQLMREAQGAPKMQSSEETARMYKGED